MKSKKSKKKKPLTNDRKSQLNLSKLKNFQFFPYFHFFSFVCVFSFFIFQLLNRSYSAASFAFVLLFLLTRKKTWKKNCELKKKEDAGKCWKDLKLLNKHFTSKDEKKIIIKMLNYTFIHHFSSIQLQAYCRHFFSSLLI